jgi:hypothetical protein
MGQYNSVQIEHRENCKGRIIRQLEISKYSKKYIQLTHYYYICYILYVKCYINLLI